MKVVCVALAAIVLAGCTPRTAGGPVPQPPAVADPKVKEPECSRQFDADDAGFQTCLD